MLLSNGQFKLFEFEAENDKYALKYGGEIGDFNLFEYQLGEILKKEGFKTFPWISNYLTFGIPNNCANVQMKAYFDAGDYLGAAKTILIHYLKAYLIS